LGSGGFRGDFSEELAEHGEELFFTADNAGQFDDAVFEFGEFDGVDDAGFSCGEEEAVVFGDVGDHEAGEIEFSIFHELIQAFLEGFVLGPEVVEAEFFNLGNGNFPAVFGVFLAVGADDFSGLQGLEGGACGEEVFGKLFGVNFGDVSEPGEDGFVMFCGGGRGEEQGVGDDASAHAAGDAFGGDQSVDLEHSGDDAAGGTHDFVDEADGFFGGEVSAEAVVVDDFENDGIFGTFDGLGKFIVVDQNELGFGRIDQVGFGEGSNQFFRAFLQDGKEGLVGLLDFGEDPVHEICGFELHVAAFNGTGYFA